MIKILDKNFKLFMDKKSFAIHGMDKVDEINELIDEIKLIDDIKVRIESAIKSRGMVRNLESVKSCLELLNITNKDENYLELINLKDSAAERIFKRNKEYKTIKSLIFFIDVRIKNQSQEEN